MKGLVEGLLFVSGEDGLTLDEICNITEKSKEEIKLVIKDLYKDYENNDRGIQIEYLGNHFKLTTKKEHKEYYKKLIEEDNSKLSQSSLKLYNITSNFLDYLGLGSIDELPKLDLKNNNSVNKDDDLFESRYKES